MPELVGELTHVDLIGSAGTLTVAAAYLLTQLRLLNSSDLSFPLANLAGSLLIVYSLYHNFNLASALMEFFWITISAFGIVQWFREHRIRRTKVPLQPDRRTG